MNRIKKMLSIILTSVMVFIMPLNNITVEAAKKKIVIPNVKFVKAPVLEYIAGDIVKFDLNAPNYSGKMQYRVILWDGNKKQARDLWTTGDRYYKNWMPYGRTVFNLHWRIDEPGLYRITVYVKRAGIKNNSTALKKYNCDSYIESQPFLVKEKNTVFEKDGQTYGSNDQDKVETYNDDVSITGKDITFNNAAIQGDLSITGNNAVIKNVKVSDKIVIDPGKDGSCTLDNVTARDIQILSGGCNSIHIKNSKAETMNVNSKNKVRIEVDGDTNIVSVLANGYVIFDKKSGTFGAIVITKNENGESTIEFRGDIQDKVEVEGTATIKTGQASRIAYLFVNTKNSTDKIKLEGNYEKVVVNSTAKLELQENTKLKSLIAYKDVEVTMDKTAVITNIEKNNNDVVIIKEGSSDPDPDPDPNPKDNNDDNEYIPILVSTITVTSESNSTTVINGKTLQMEAVVKPINARNKKIVWTVIPGTGKATINASGLLTAVEVGNVTVKATNPDSGVFGTKIIAIIDDPALIAEYTNAENIEAIKAVLGENKLGLTITDYDGLDDIGKTEVAASLFGIKSTLVTKALIQTAVTAAISKAVSASIERVLVAEYTNAASADVIKGLLNENKLGLILTDYDGLGDIGKTEVVSELLSIKATLTTKSLIQTAVTSAISKAVSALVERALVAEYTNAEDTDVIKGLLNENKLGLTLTDYDGLDDIGKTEVAASLFDIKSTLTTKALIQTAVTAAILESKPASIERTLVAEYTNASDAGVIKGLLNENKLGLTLTDYVKLDDTGKVEVSIELFNIKSTLTTKVLIQTAVAAATSKTMPASIERALVLEYTNAANSFVIKGLLNENKLGLILTDYGGLDDKGKIEVAASLFNIKSTLTKVRIQAAVTEAISKAMSASIERALVAEYTNAANADVIKGLLSGNKLGLTLTDYDGLDDIGKSEVAAKLFSVKAALTAKELIQGAVTAAISESKPTSIERALVAEYTNAASVEAVKVLLDNNELKLDLTNYSRLSFDGKLIVAKALYDKKASLVSKQFIQAAVASAMPVFITGIRGNSGVYKQGDIINITINFSEKVIVIGTPVIHLDINGDVGDAIYSFGSGASVLVFEYIVYPNDNTCDLDYTGTDALDVEHGEIKAVDNAKTMIFTLPAPLSSDSLSGTSNIVIDTTAPSSIVISAPNEIPANGSITLSVEGGPLNNTSWIDILNEIRANTGKGSNWIVGVQDSDLDILPAADGNSAVLKNNSNAVAFISADFVIPKDKVFDVAGNYAGSDITINSYIMAKVKEVSSSTGFGYYKAEYTIPINVIFDEAVDVTGSPALCLETGANDSLARYVSGSGTNTLTFVYKVQSGDTSDDLDYTSENALILNGGIIKFKGSDIDANLTLPLPGTEGSLGYINDIRIDTKKPASITISSKNSIPSSGEGVILTAVDGVLNYDTTWLKIFELIKNNTSSGENWITGISSSELEIIFYCDGIHAALCSHKDAVINRDFIIPKDFIKDEAGNTADNDIRIDACDTVTDIAIADKNVVSEINNEAPDLYAAYGKTVGQLKSAIKAVDDSPQTYIVTDSNNNNKADDSIILGGDKLIVTSESGLCNKIFPIRVAPEPVTTIQLVPGADFTSNITIVNNKGSESYLICGTTNMTVSQIKNGLQSTNGTIQTYEIVDSQGNIMSDDTKMACGGNHLVVTAYDGLVKTSYDIIVDLSPISIDDISVIEGNSGTTDVVFTIRRLASINSSLTLDYEISTMQSGGYPAFEGQDYTYDYMSCSITFNPGEIVKTVTVKIIGDTVRENDEMFQIKASYYYAPFNSTFCPRATCTIINDD